MTITHIEQLTKRYTEYDVIQTHTDLPDFPEFRIRLLFAFLETAGPAPTKSELYSLVTAIVQMGLDTHDEVPVRNDDKSKPEARSRQLKVLAGDYFSSRYYNLLAEAGEVAAVRLLAASVCEINRLKVSLYTAIRQMKLSAEDYLRQKVRIKSELFLSLSGLLPEWARRAMTELLHGVTRLEVLTAEKNRLTAGESIQGSWAFWHMLDRGTKEEQKALRNGAEDGSRLKTLLLKYKVGAELDRLLQDQLEQVAAKLKELTSERMLPDLQPLSELIGRWMNRPRILEER
ncbi:heptaprenyl diphosphate synthase component 1 [Gorillibacterium sp. sgz500922]|uniref:heptaprenyl diphosphate synthase component 1 n=1 Tax=Gorillibacterium sp. sgz500922 TaxID=3446694 RepID=UPI003F6774E6